MIHTETPVADRVLQEWDLLPASIRADLLRAGIPFPGETSAEARCRVKAKLDLLDDGDLQALTGCGEDALARHRVNGTGPRPIRILRSVFYTKSDVVEWISNHRDGVRGTAAAKNEKAK